MYSLFLVSPNKKRNDHIFKVVEFCRTVFKLFTTVYKYFSKIGSCTKWIVWFSYLWISFTEKINNYIHNYLLRYSLVLNICSEKILESARIILLQINIPLAIASPTFPNSIKLLTIKIYSADNLNFKLRSCFLWF